jgi:hypothetical protein
MTAESTHHGWEYSVVLVKLPSNHNAKMHLRKTIPHLGICRDGSWREVADPTCGVRIPENRDRYILCAPNRN